MQNLAFPGQMVQKWPRKGRTRDPLLRCARLARFAPFGGKSHPRSSNPASESLLEHVLALLSLMAMPCPRLSCLPAACCRWVQRLLSVVEEPWYAHRVGRCEKMACLQLPALSLPFHQYFQYYSIRSKNPKLNLACSDLLHPFPPRVLASLAATVVCVSILCLIPFLCISPFIGLTRQVALC